MLPALILRGYGRPQVGKPSYASHRASLVIGRTIFVIEIAEVTGVTEVTVMEVIEVVPEITGVTEVTV